MKLSPRACPLCGSEDESRVFVAANHDEEKLDGFAFASRKMPEFMHYRMVRCPTCDLLYANPGPDLAWLQEAYEGAEFDAGEESRLAAQTYARELRRFADRLPDRTGALDVGTGDGAFLAQLISEGFEEVAGIEPSRAPREQADPKIRPLIRDGFFRSGALPPDSLSLVSCFQILEHTDDPRSLAQAAFEMLKPGGAFFGIAHNYRAVTARILGTKSPIYDIEHLQLHSKKSLRYMLEETGFEEVQVRVLRNDYPLSYWIKLLPASPGLKHRMSSTLSALRLARLQIPMWAGNLTVVGYKPR